MSEQVEELRRLLADYLLDGNRDAVISDAALTVARRALDATSKMLVNGPLESSESGLEAAMAFFLLRSRELHCNHEHSVASDLLASGSSIRKTLLIEACGCLVRHATARLNSEWRNLLSAECEFEMALLERIHDSLETSAEHRCFDVDAIYWLAQLRWHRSPLLPDTDRDRELTASLAGFAAVYEPGRTILPPSVREYFECLDADDRPSGGLVEEPYRSDSSLGSSRSEAALSVLLARVSLKHFPSDAAELALASALTVRAAATGALVDVLEALGLAEGIWERVSRQPSQVRILAAGLVMQAHCIIAASTGEYARLDAALKVGVATVQGASADSWQTWSLIMGVTQILIEQAVRCGDSSKLDDAIGLVQQVSMATKAHHEQLRYRSDENGDLFVESLFFTALLLKQRHDLTGELRSLKEAVQFASVACDISDQSGPQRRRYALSAANIVFAQYEAAGSPKDLDDAITIIRAALWSRPPSDDEPTIEERRRLAEFLHIRFGRDHHAADQREAMELFVELAREVCDDPDYARRASLLSAAANAAAPMAASPAEAREAVGWARKSLALSENGSPQAAYAHFALGQSLFTLHAYDDPAATLDEIIAHFQAALSAATDEELSSAAAYRLAQALVRRDGTVDPEAATALAEAGGMQGSYRHNTAVLRAAALLDNGQGRPGSSAERATAMALLREVALAPDATTDLQLLAARGWGQEALAQGDFASAALAFRSAIDAQPWQLLWARLPDERRALVESLRGIASAAASCAARVGMLEHSVESLERGRAILWGQVIQMRQAARLVATADTVLGQRFREALTAQEDFARNVEPESMQDAINELGAVLTQLARTSLHPKDLRLRLANDWNSMIAEARGIPGLEDLMRPPNAAELRNTVTGGTVVLLNPDANGSHALLITQDGVDNVPLPDLEIDAALEQVANFTLAVHALDDPDADYGPELRGRMSRTVDETRKWLWDVIAQPVLNRLRLTKPPGPAEAWPRIWWCPSGLLARFPLHAAGTDDRPGSCVIDLVVSSYTISLTALRPVPGLGSASESILVLGASDLPGAPELPGVRQEIADLRAKFPDSLSTLDGPQATRSSALREIVHHSWLHLACHASPGIPGQPPYLFLHDGPLRIERLGWTVSDSAELAYLSGCSTAEAALDATDEARHITAALQAAGFPNVIGTLWGAVDDVGVVVAKQFYDRITHPGTRAEQPFAEALHHTIHSIRDAGFPAFYWAPYVHYGR